LFAVSGVADSTRFALSLPGTAGSARRASTSVRASGAGRGAAGTEATAVDGGGASSADGELSDVLCEQPVNPNAAITTTALEARKKCRCIQRGYSGYMSPPTDAMQVTPAAVRAMTVTAAKPVARTFNVTEILSLSLTRRRDYQWDLRRDFLSSFDSAHQAAMAGSVEGSTHHSWCGRGGPT
jgi:hypothetical protein